MNLIPAILSRTREDFEEKAKLAESFADYVQVDFMDGAFVPTESVSVEDVLRAKPSFEMEAHLMVEHPSSYLSGLKEAGFRRVYFHVESSDDPRSLIRGARSLGIEIGVALKPDTELPAIEDLLGEVEAVLFLTVHPGGYGHELIPDVLGKLKAFKRSHAETSAGADGGIKLDNLDLVAEAKPDFVTVGSAIFDARDPIAAYREFLRRIEDR